MKPFVMLKMPILLGAFGAALMFSPTCKAQEVSPEQFSDNNTEPFQTAQKAAAVAPKKEAAKPKAVKSHASQTKKAEPVQTAQLTPIHEVSKPEGQGAEVADKRKATTGKSKKQ